MIIATISDMKNRLSAYLREVRKGETVLIVDRREPVARLEPFSYMSADERLQRLEREGVVARRGAEAAVSAIEPPVSGVDAVLRALLEERRGDQDWR